MQSFSLRILYGPTLTESIFMMLSSIFRDESAGLEKPVNKSARQNKFSLVTNKPLSVSLSYLNTFEINNISMFRKTFLLIVLLSVSSLSTLCAQTNIGNEPDIDYTNPKNYFIGGITVSGNFFSDQSLITMLTGLSVGD